MEPFGFLVVDKPQGLTSHDVVAQVRRGIRVKRVGHAGTLDPMATGVLVLCIGTATRLSEYVMDSTKVYTTTIRLGEETDTYDADGQIIATHDTSHLAITDIENALTHFQGEVAQIPPMYSAIKMGGKKLYDLAREGKEIERASRTVSLKTTLLDATLPDLTIRVECTAGTYIRSIAHDLGEMIGVGAHLTALRRDASGTLDSPVTWQQLLDSIADGTWPRYLVDERVALAKYPEVLLSKDESRLILNGRTFSRDGADGVSSNSLLLRAYDSSSHFIAMVETQPDAQGTRYQPVKVFHQQEAAP